MKNIWKQEAIFILGISKSPSKWNFITLPQIAFIGRSNVGKSSIINALCSRKNLAKTSKTPGGTKQLNFFNLADKLCLVDLPGYGFANVDFNTHKQWNNVISDYFIKSEKLMVVNILIDIRRGIMDKDIFAINLIQQFSKKWQIIVTKSDKAKNLTESVNNIKQEIAKAIGYLPNVITTSTINNTGIKELRSNILLNLVTNNQSL